MFCGKLTRVWKTNVESGGVASVLERIPVIEASSRPNNITQNLTSADHASEQPSGTLSRRWRHDFSNWFPKAGDADWPTRFAHLVQYASAVGLEFGDRDFLHKLLMSWSIAPSQVKGGGQECPPHTIRIIRQLRPLIPSQPPRSCLIQLSLLPSA
jgi:hypothetical protein